MLTLCWVLAGGYPFEEFGKKGQVERGSCFVFISMPNSIPKRRNHSCPAL